MPEEHIPIFNKQEKKVDGQWVEIFYIDNCEVNQKTYYSLLEDLMDKDKNINSKPNTISQIPLESIENAMLTNENQVEAEVETREYVNDILTTILQMDDKEEQLEFLLNEMVFQYRQGFFIGQIELTEAYWDGTKKSRRILRDAYEDMISEYEDQ